MIGTIQDITIVGLGPGDPGWRTIEAQRALDSATRLFVRGHDGIDLSDLLTRENVTNVDTMRVPDAVPGGRWQEATHAICDAAANGPVVLAIPGHPRFGEGLVLATLNAATRHGLTTDIMDGISVVDLIATALNVDPILKGAQLFNAREVAGIAAADPFAGGLFTASPRRPMLFTHVYDTEVCAGLARTLGRFFPPDHPVTRVEGAGKPDERISEHTIGELTTLPGGPLVALWIPAQGELDAVRDPRTMQHIVARLRQPDGCPWDRKQTHQSLRKSMIDEVYEIVDAIDSGDPAHLAEELGDMFLLIVMQAQIAHEAGHFSIEDVYRGIATKIVGRHPHVFGDAIVETDADLSGIWAEAKAKEKVVMGERGGKDIDGEPFSMPALERAARVLKKHPVVADDNAPDLLRLVSDIIARGEDPEAVLRQQLREHVEQRS